MSSATSPVVSSAASGALNRSRGLISRKCRRGRQTKVARLDGTSTVLAGKIEAAVRAHQQHPWPCSHELRTPLATQSGWTWNCCEGLLLIQEQGRQEQDIAELDGCGDELLLDAGSGRRQTE